MLIVAFLGIGWGLDKLYDQLTETSGQPTTLDLHKGTLFLLNRELARLPMEYHEQHIKALSQSFGYPIGLIHAAHLSDVVTEQNLTLTPEQQAFFDKGGAISLFHQDKPQGWFIQKLAGHPVAVVLGPIQQNKDAQDTEVYSIVLFTTLAVVVFLLVWPLSRGLLLLTKTAEQFGNGNFDTRVSSHIYGPLSKLSQRFNDMAARIQGLIQSHKDLSHAVSHELRTPIARIRFAAEMAKESPDLAKRNAMFDSIDRNIEELDNLVEELLVYARFDREEPELHFEHKDLTPLCQQAIHQVQLVEPTLQLQLHSDTHKPQICLLDAAAFNRILDNLLRNACRYARQNIVIKLMEKDQQWQISVEDDGPGIPSAQRQKLFDPFYRLDKSRDKKSGGIGLGLAISKRLVELHRGKIAVEEAELGGACFVITLPKTQ